MKFKIAKQDLEHVLKTVGAAAESDDSVLNGHFVFRLCEGAVEVLAHREFRQAAGMPLRATVEDDGGAQAFTVSANRILAWTKAVGNVAVTIECKDTTVHAHGPHGTIKLPSLDPAQFPYWDDRLEGCEKVATLPGVRLAGALDYIRKFVADRENKRPDISLVQARFGRLFATDTQTVSSVKIMDDDDTSLLENCFFRLHVKDIGDAVKILNTEGNVEIYESGDMTKDHKDREVRATTHVYFKRADGLVYGFSCPNAEFPDLNWEEDPSIDISFEVNAEILQSAIAQIKAAMRKEEERLRFVWEGDKLNLSTSATLSKETVSVSVDVGQNQGGDDFPAAGFRIDNTYLTHIISKFKLKEIQLDVLPRGETSGMIHVIQWEGKDSYATILMYKDS